MEYELMLDTTIKKERDEWPEVDTESWRRKVIEINRLYDLGILHEWAEE